MESSTFSPLSRECMAWLCGINENDYIPQQVAAYWNIHIRCDSWVVKADSNCVSKQEVFDMGATWSLEVAPYFDHSWRSPMCCKYVVAWWWQVLPVLIVPASARCCVREVWCAAWQPVIHLLLPIILLASQNLSRDLARPRVLHFFWAVCPWQSISIIPSYLDTHLVSINPCVWWNINISVYTLQTFTTERNSLNEPYHDAVKIDGDNLNNNKR